MSDNETIIISGTEQINAMRLLTLRRGLLLEMKGLKMSRGPSVASILKREFGFKGNAVKLLTQLEEYMTDQKIPFNPA